MMAVAKVTRTSAIIELTMDEEEASVLMDIMNRIGGDPEKSRRGSANRIRMALNKAGIKGTDRNDIQFGFHAIYFVE